MDNDTKAAVAGTLREIASLMEAVDSAELAAFTRVIGESGRIFLAAAGRSGLMLRAFAMRLMHMGKSASMIGDTATPSAAAGDLFLAASGSGETASVLAVMRKAKNMGLKTALVTTAPQSTMGTLADTILTIPAPSPKRDDNSGVKSTQPMGNLFEQTLFLTLDSTIAVLMRQGDITSAAMFTRHANLE